MVVDVKVLVKQKARRVTPHERAPKIAVRHVGAIKRKPRIKVGVYLPIDIGKIKVKLKPRGGVELGVKPYKGHEG